MREGNKKKKEVTGTKPGGLWPHASPPGGGDTMTIQRLPRKAAFDHRIALNELTHATPMLTNFF